MHLMTLAVFLPLALGAANLQPNPSLLLDRSEGKPIEGKYIVKLNTKNITALHHIVSLLNITPDHHYTHAIVGFAANLTDEHVKKLKADPLLHYIEQDVEIDAPSIETEADEDFRKPQDEAETTVQVGGGDEATVSTDKITMSSARSHERRMTKIKRLGSLFPRGQLPAGVVTQVFAPWGLARLSHLKPGIWGYRYHRSAGENVCVYVLDSGLSHLHPDFNGRAKFLKNFSADPDDDYFGHGTYIAGIIGSKNYGVAKKANILGVKVQGNNGASRRSAILAGMDFVVRDARSRSCPRGVVVNVSVAGPLSKAINNAAGKIVRSGYFLAVGAGNWGKSALNYSPASERLACTVGAIDKRDRLGHYSNWGPGVNILAPGADIRSLASSSRNRKYASRGPSFKTGTSVATPHIAGLGAYLLGLGKSADGLCGYIRSTALKGVVDLGIHSNDGTPNLLANNGIQ
ncbi:hypothetical protein QQS21_009911 [Conoideocrella luteorostrata]|uniref:Uncharacterized protein n=1 Tax=Conoideocrella luteorostrata TaxID=1105319 RepID=A0AAJ0FPX6_9HYPO|nr:hypothetical protein QQS21_009911 [Conoideocrella luteorostrata]